MEETGALAAINSAIASGTEMVSTASGGMIAIAAILCGFGIVYGLLKRG